MNLSKTKIEIEQFGFLSVDGNLYKDTFIENKWKRVDNYHFSALEIPVNSNVTSFNISYCNPG